MLVLRARKILGLTVLVMAGWMTACSGGSEAPAPRADGLPALDPGAWLACRQFAGILPESQLLTKAELRARLQTVYKNASVRPNSDVAKASFVVLRDITADDVEAFAVSAPALAAACKDWQARSPK